MWRRRVGKVERGSGLDGKRRVGEMGKNVGWIEKESITRAFAHE
jgi:hypothetical protein